MVFSLYQCFQLRHPLHNLSSKDPPEAYDDILDREIDPLEVRITPNSLKSGTSTVTRDSLKRGSENLSCHLPVKKGDPEVPYNSCPIFILRPALKLHTRMLNSRLMVWCAIKDKISDLLEGFRKKTSIYRPHIYPLSDDSNTAHWM